MLPLWLKSADKITNNINIVTMNQTASTQVTFEDIRAILKETAEQRKQFEAQHAKNIAEYEEQRKKESAEAEKRREEYDKRAAEADKRREEYDKRREKEYAEWHARWKEVSKEIGGISNNNGYFAEEYFINALQKKKTFAGIRYDYVDPNMKYRLGNVQDEFDIVMFNGSSIAIIEVKYRVQLDFLTTLTTQKVQNFRTLFPAYAKHKIYLGIASMSFNKKVIMGAKQLGIGMLKPQGDTLECDTEHIKAY
ncbi:hypothetical protein FACS1894199_01450 [Bacteroidia bacterium]|nr:hypothetical protein FACS1894199_01450 [Bacteroidia bacterium]